MYGMPKYDYYLSIICVNDLMKEFTLKRFLAVSCVMDVAFLYPI